MCVQYMNVATHVSRHAARRMIIVGIESDAVQDYREAKQPELSPHIFITYPMSTRLYSLTSTKKLD